MSETIYERNIRHTALNKRIYYGTLSPDQLLAEGKVSVLIEQIDKKDVEDIKSQTAEIGGLIDQALGVTGKLPSLTSYLTNFKNGLKSSEQIVQAALLGKKPGFFDKLFGKDVSPADALQQVAAINQKASAALVSVSNAADTIASALEGNLPEGADEGTALKDIQFPPGSAFNIDLLSQGVEKAFTSSSGGIFSKAVQFFKDKIGKLIIPNYKSEELNVKKTIEEFMSLSLKDLDQISKTLNADAVPEPPSGAVSDINTAAAEDDSEGDSPSVDPKTFDAINKVVADLESSGLNQELIGPLRDWMTKTVNDPEFSKIVQQEAFLGGSLSDLLFEQDEPEIKFSDLTKIFKKNVVSPFTKLKDKAFEFMADAFAGALQSSGISVSGDPKDDPSDDESQIDGLESEVEETGEDPDDESKFELDAETRAEINALRQLFAQLEEDELPGAIDQVKDAWVAAGIPADIIGDLLNPNVSIEDALAKIPDADVAEDIGDAIPPDPSDLLSDDEQPEQSGDEDAEQSGEEGSEEAEENEETAEPEDDGLSEEEVAEVEAEVEEITSQLGDGPISKRQLTAILKSMPDIVGQGQKAKRARRKFRLAVNDVAGKEVFEESILNQVGEDEKFLNECVGDPIEKWRKLAGLE